MKKLKKHKEYTKEDRVALICNQPGYERGNWNVSLKEEYLELLLLESLASRISAPDVLRENWIQKKIQDKWLNPDGTVNQKALQLLVQKAIDAIEAENELKAKLGGRNANF